MTTQQSQQDYVHWLPELFPRQGRWTEVDYFALPENNRIIELVNGELIMTPGPSYAHQKATATLHRYLEDHVEANALGVAIIAAFDVRLWENHIRQPDVLFIRSENIGQLVEGKYCDGPPDWVAEVISEGTRKIDEEDKLAEYAKASIPEYWLLDRKIPNIRVYVLRGGDSYMLAGTYTAGQVARSETIAGFTVEVDQVFKSTSTP